MSEATGSHHALIGRQFPGGSYTLEPWRAWLLADALGADPWDEQPHPVMAWMAAVGGMGMTWDELFAWFDATADDGPMFGEHETTLHVPLKPAVTYRVSGKITSFDRKTGRRAGTFDVVGYELSLHDGQEHVATCWNSLVLPRRSPA
ncbi:hypothetical protein [Microbacterium sp. A93]|uniref:hypothetical protein n=1 Tax=Microbacterium sp. A93 TaxID=3450716 RepID=UPI003F41FE48